MHDVTQSRSLSKRQRHRAADCGGGSAGRCAELDKATLYFTHLPLCQIQRNDREEGKKGGFTHPVHFQEFYQLRRAGVLISSAGRSLRTRRTVKVEELRQARRLAGDLLRCCVQRGDTLPPSFPPSSPKEPRKCWKLPQRSIDRGPPAHFSSAPQRWEGGSESCSRCGGWRERPRLNGSSRSAAALIQTATLLRPSPAVSLKLLLKQLHKLQSRSRLDLIVSGGGKPGCTSCKLRQPKGIDVEIDALAQRRATLDPLVLRKVSYCAAREKRGISEVGFCRSCMLGLCRLE